MWAKLALAVLQLIVAAVTAAREYSLRAQGYQQATAETQAKNAEALKRMVDARAAATVRFDSTNGLPDHDPHLRD